MTERWNCHEHRDELKVSIFDTVYHEEHGQLCQGHRDYDGTCFVPIQFESKSEAHIWIESGFIAQIQEGLTNLKVGFVTKCWIPRED